MPDVEFRPHCWCDKIPIAKTLEAWLLLEFEKEMANPYAQDVPPIQMPSGATATVQLSVINVQSPAQPSLTQTPALRADLAAAISVQRRVVILAGDLLSDGRDLGRGRTMPGASSNREDQRLLSSSGDAICYSCTTAIPIGAMSCSSCGARGVPATPPRRGFPSTFEAISEHLIRYAGRGPVPYLLAVYEHALAALRSH